jgi:hypothetical protein
VGQVEGLGGCPRLATGPRAGCLAGRLSRVQSVGVDLYSTPEVVYSTLGVQVDYNVVHLRTSLLQLFLLLFQNFEKVVQMIKLKRFGGAPNGYPLHPYST